MLLKYVSDKILSALGAVLLLFTIPAFADSILSDRVLSDRVLYNKGLIKVTAGETATSLQITIKTIEAKDLTVAKLEQPSRLVLDLVKEKDGEQKTVVFSHNPFVKSLRFGKHPDKLRLVIDLQSSPSEPFPPYEVQRTEVEYTILFGINKTVTTTSTTHSTSTTTSSSTSTSTTTEPSSTSTTVVVTTSTLAPRPEPKPSVIESAPPKVDKNVAAAIASGKVVLSAITFESVERPSVKLALSSRADFKLARRSDREYLLIIQKAVLAATYLQYPIFPPQDFDGFTHVLITPVEENIEVAIGVERATKLTAFVKDDSIWVTTKPSED